MQSRHGRLRADAVRNRERLLTAAREVFAEHGLDVSMRELARHAGVSEPTLRRRFAGRDELIAAAFEDKVVLYAEVAEAALKDPDPWAGFTGFLRRLARAQLADRGFADVLTRTFPASLEYEQNRLRAWAAAEKLIVRAKAAGRLREDFVAEDIVLLLLAQAGVLAGSGRVAERMSNRLLAYLPRPASRRTPVTPMPPSCVTRRGPSWAVIATEDKAFDQVMLQHMAKRAGAQVTNVSASHALFMTQAGVVADVIATAAQSATG